MMATAFQTFLLERYPIITAQNVQLGRRKARLQVVDEFFRLDPPSRQLYTTAATPSPEALAAAPCSTDVDPIDALLSDAPGIVVRTNFSDDTTWAAFLSALADGEKELLADAADPPPADDAADGSGSDSDSSEEESTVLSTSGSAEDSTRKDSRQLMFFSIIDPISVDDRAQLADACNLAVLRLVADAGVCPAPPVPQGSKRIKPGHRLVDLDGYQEVYTGRGLWIYDAQSNADGALRMVNLKGDVYGTATGDSWRMRASHITEMQVNMTFHGLKVNFGGMDRWDYPERIRNMEFANLQT